MNLICFSHLRWDFVFQRPQHILTRLCAYYNIFYIEEPEFDGTKDGYQYKIDKQGVHIIKPVLQNSNHENVVERQKNIVDRFLSDYNISKYILWYYTPMALKYSRHLHPALTVYDCMDELSAFKFAPPELQILEKELFSKADIVFTGGHSLFKQKEDQHKNIYPFPSSIEKHHFEQARKNIAEPEDQQLLPYPRFGFYGVIDERFDIDLIKEVSEKKPEWQFILIGPVVKIEPAMLPRRSNIHYLGPKPYNQLPAYLKGWDIAIVCFAINESTRFISPTKTPEYLAAGKPVISTPIADVVHPYGDEGLVHIASDAEEFIHAGEKELSASDKKVWLTKTDAFLAGNSWHSTVFKMKSLIDKELNKVRNKKTKIAIHV